MKGIPVSDIRHQKVRYVQHEEALENAGKVMPPSSKINGASSTDQPKRVYLVQFSL